MAQFDTLSATVVRPAQKHDGRRIVPAPVVVPLGWCLGGQQFQRVAALRFEFVPVGRFLTLDAVFGPWHRI